MNNLFSSLLPNVKNNIWKHQGLPLVNIKGPFVIFATILFKVNGDLVPLNCFSVMALVLLLAHC